MSYDMKKYFCPRLIDYIIIVSCKQNKTSTTTSQQQKETQSHYYHQLSENGSFTASPELLRRYPLNDHNDFKLPQDVIFFCQPEGCLNYEINSKFTKFDSGKINGKASTSFIFTLTEKDSARVRYGICINFYRRVEQHQTHHRSNSHKANKTHNYSTSSNESTVTAAASTTTNETKRNSLTTTTKHLRRSSSHNRATRHRRYVYTLTSLCIISHHPFFSLFRECLSILRRIIDACNLRSQSNKFTPTSTTASITPAATTKLNNMIASRDNVWNVLTGCCSDQIFNIISSEIREIETWILRLLSAPVPVPGKTKLIIDILPNESPMLFALPDHTRFNLVDFPIHLPLELLGVELCMKVFTLILLENKVVFQSRDYNALTMSIMAFVYSLYPLEYMFPIIPLLPLCMNETEQLLLAPTPFLIGIPANFFQFKANFLLPDDVWLVDLDKNKIIPAKHSEPIPDIPEPENSIVKNHLKQALNSLSSSPEPIKNFQIFFNEQNGQQIFPDGGPYQKNERLYDLISKSFNPLIYGNDVDSVDIATRISMVQFLNSKNILANYNEHTRTLRLYPRPVVAFQYNSFIRSRPIKSNFIIKLARTQAVEYLAEWSLCPTNVAYLRIQTGVFDPSLIGDKAKWYCRYLNPIQFRTYEENTTLAAAIQLLNSDKHSQNSSHFDSNNNANATPTDESAASGASDCDSQIYDEDDEYMNDDARSKTSSRSSLNDVSKPIHIYPKDQAHTMCVDVPSVYSPPSKFINLDDDSVDGENLSQKSGYESSSFTTSSSSSSVGDIYNENYNSATTSDSTGTSQIGNQKLSKIFNQQISNDSKSSSATITPVSKTFPRTPFDSNILESLTTHDQQRRSSTLPPQRSLDATVSSTPPSNISQSVLNKTKQYSLISQLSDELSDAASKAAKRAGSAISDLVNENRLPNTNPTQITTAATVVAATNSNVATTLPTTSSTNTTIVDSIPSSSSTATLTPQLPTSLQRQQSHNFPTTPRDFKRPTTRQNSAESANMNNSNRPSVQINKRNELQNSDLNTENQQFLKEILFSVFEGQGVGWLKYNRLKKLMEDENYRNFVLSRLNTSLDKKLSNDEEHIEEVKVSKAVFKGMAKVITSIVHGLEQTYANNGIGGMASAFQLLEIAHTHYWIRDNNSSKHDTSPISEKSSPYENVQEEKFSDPLTTPHLINQQTQSSPSNIVEVKNSTTENDGISQKRPSSLSKYNSVDTTDATVTSLMLDERRKSKINHHTIKVINENVDQPETMTQVSTINEKSPTGSISSVTAANKSHSNSLATPVHTKSQFSAGYVYKHGALMNAVAIPTNNEKSYLFETLINNSRSPLWDQMQFWEDVFLDAVAQERDIIGLDQGPSEMMERYNQLGSAEKKRLELDEDHLLAVMLYNLIAFMVMMRVSKEEVRRKVRRMLGKCHIGLSMSQQVNELLDHINLLSGNDIELRPVGSRLMQKQSFTVHSGTDNTGAMLFMEVCDDCIILRSVKGEICQRWWFEKLVNMTYCPKTKVLCLWCKQEGETQLNKFYTKKCRELYFSIKEAMEKAASRLNGVPQPGPELCGEFPINDIKTNQSGVLRIGMEGIWLIFDNEKEFIELKRVRKCTTQKDDTFVLEEFDPKSKHLLIRKYKSSMASQICYAVLCVFSYMAAGQDKNENKNTI